MFDPFNPVSMSAGIITNLAYDILKYRTQSSRNTLVGRMAHWAGLKEATFDERLRDMLMKTAT